MPSKVVVTTLSTAATILELSGNASIIDNNLAVVIIN